jgi:hypothetical protein
MYFICKPHIISIELREKHFCTESIHDSRNVRLTFTRYYMYIERSCLFAFSIVRYLREKRAMYSTANLEKISEKINELLQYAYIY